MAITVGEKPESREGVDGESKELIYIIEGTDDDAAATAQLKATAPMTHSGMARQSVGVAAAGLEVWLGTVTYGRPETSWPSGSVPQTGDSAFSFEIGEESRHVTWSEETVGSYKAAILGAQNAPDFHGALVVKGIEIEGIDVGVPVYKFAETHYLADSIVTESYRGNLGRLYNHTNNAPFKGCAIGECKFCGASGSKRGGADWEIGFRFAAMQNRTDIEIDGIVGPIAKKGWEFLWVYYKTVLDEGPPKMLVPSPVAAYVERILLPGDFSQFRIGV